MDYSMKVSVHALGNMPTVNVLVLLSKELASGFTWQILVAV